MATPSGKVVRQMNKKEMLIEFGSRVKMLRKQKGMTMDELAEKAGYNSRSSISMIEAGKRDVPKSRIIDMANALGVDMYFLIFGDMSDDEPKEVSSELTLSTKEIELIIEYRNMSQKEQDLLLKVLKAKED